jgi:hypothetical protein
MARAFHAAVAAANRACALAIAITTANCALGGDAVIPAIAADESSLTRLCQAHGEHCGCPGCRAYFHNCDSPCEPGSAPEPVDPGTEELPIATDEPSDEGALDSFTGPLPALSGGQTGLGAVAASASAAPNMIGDFFGRGGSVQILEPIQEIAVADTAPGVFGPNGPFGIVSIVDESGASYLYRNGPPVPFGELLITNQAAINGDAITDFLLVADPTKVGTSDLDSEVAYAAVSNGIVTPSGHNLYDLFQYYQLTLPNPSAGDIVGRVRLQDNNSARPQDRVYFDYSYFHNVRFSNNGADVNRFAPGIEKTFFNGMTSVEVRVPMATTISSEAVADGPTDFSHYEFGNVMIAPKLLLVGTRDFAAAAGMGIGVPTADDISVSLVDGQKLLSVDNDSVHLVPYIACLYAPAYSDSFAHAFVTADVDANGNPVQANVSGTGLETIGRYNDQTLLSVNVAYGRWIHRDPSSAAQLNGLAWSTELHYTATVSDADSIASGNFVVGNPDADLSLLNATLGGHARFGLTTFTAAYAVPLTSDDRVFDGEFRFFVNRNF